LVLRLFIKSTGLGKVRIGEVVGEKDLKEGAVRKGSPNVTAGPVLICSQE